MVLNELDLQLSEVYRKDDNIESYDIISDHTVTTTATLTQEEGFFRPKKYSINIQTTMHPHREIKAMKK